MARKKTSPCAVASAIRPQKNFGTAVPFGIGALVAFNVAPQRAASSSNVSGPHLPKKSVEVHLVR